MRRERLWAVLLGLGAPLAVELVCRLLPIGLPDRADRYLDWATGTQDAFVERGGRLEMAPPLVEQGNNDVSFAATKSPGVIRVVCVGDSTTAGWPYNDPGSFPRWLSGVLAEVRPDLRFEVVNAGVHGFDSTRVLAVARELLRGRPDVLIFHAGYDDYQTYPLRRAKGLRLSVWLARHSQAYNAARWLEGRRSGSFSLQPLLTRLDPAQQRELTARYAENVSALEREGAAAGAFVVLTDLPYSRPKSQGYPGFGALDAMRAEQSRLAAQHGWTLARFDDLPPGRFVDHVHCDEEGYRLMAVDLARTLERSGRWPGRWRWDRLAGPAALARAIGLNGEALAHAHVRLAVTDLAGRRRDQAVREMELALEAAPNPRLVPEEIAFARSAPLDSVLAEAQAARKAGGRVR